MCNYHFIICLTLIIDSNYGILNIRGVIFIYLACFMRNKLKLILLESNLFVALGVWSLVKLTGVLHSVDVDFFADFSFWSTLLVYSFSILFSSGRSLGFKKLIFSDKLIVSKFVFLISPLVLLYFLFQLKLVVILSLIPVALVSFLYPVEIVKDEKESITLREFPYLKIFLIGISWGVVTVVLPLVNQGVSIDYSVVVETLVRSFFVVAITIPFDVRDVNTDSPNMKTIPQELGISKAKYLAYLLLLINYVYYSFIQKLEAHTLLLILVSLILTTILIKYSNNNKPKIYYVVFLESTSIMLFLSVWI